MPTGPRWGARGVTYRRQVILVLVCFAVVPLAVFGFAAFRSVEDVVGQEALGQARTAVRGVAAVLARDAADLDETVESYATWPVLKDEVASLDLDAIRQDVVQFQVDQGEADVVVLIVGDRQVQAGPGPAAAALLRAERNPSWPDPQAADRPDLRRPRRRCLSRRLPGDRPRRSDRRRGDAADGAVGLAFARRLDPAFVVDARDVTGFDGAVFDRSGRAPGRQRPERGRGRSPVRPPGRIRRRRMPSSDPGSSGGSIALPDRDGQAAGWFVATMRTEGIQTVGSRLVPLLAVGLGLAVAAAALLAVLLGRRLRLRLDAIEGGLSAMAAGDLDVRLPADERDEIGRLAVALDRTADTLARRDRILREAIVAVGDLTPDLGVDRVEVAGVAAAARIFDLVDCRLEDLDGTFLAGSSPEAVETGESTRASGPAVPFGPGSSTATGGRAVDEAASAVAVAPGPAGVATAPVTADVGPVEGAGSTGPRDLRLVGRIRSGRDWSEADQSLLDVYARLLRAAIDDAAVHARALDRVDRLGRLARLQGDFLRGVSHNLQAPLTNIVVVSEELVTADRTDAHAREGALIIRAEADRLARLVGQLLTLSRLESGTLRVEEEPVAPEPIIQRVWGSLGSDRPFRLEDRSDGMVAVADRAALEQVAWMLLDNAIKYAPDRGDQPSSSSRMGPRGSRSRSGTRARGSCPRSGHASSAGSSAARPARASRAPDSASTWPAAWSGRWAARSATCRTRMAVPGSDSRSPASAPTGPSDEGPGGSPGPSGCAVAHFRNAARKVVLPRLGRYPEHDPRWAAPADPEPDGGVTPE